MSMLWPILDISSLYYPYCWHINLWLSFIVWESSSSMHIESSNVQHLALRQSSCVHLFGAQRFAFSYRVCGRTRTVISVSRGCLTVPVRSVMTAVVSSPPSCGGITVVYVGRSSVAGAVIRKYPVESLALKVRWLHMFSILKKICCVFGRSCQFVQGVSGNYSRENGYSSHSWCDEY